MRMGEGDPRMGPHGSTPGVTQPIGRATTLEAASAADVRGKTRPIAHIPARMPVWPLFLLGFALLGVGLLIGPRLATNDEAGYNCVGSVALAGPFGFELNCDSPEFMWLARDPAGLLDHLNSRQSRPGLILLAALITAPLSLVVAPDGPPTPVYQGLYDPLRVAATFDQDRPAYLAYILINLAIVLASFQVLRRAIDRGQRVRGLAEAIILAAIGLLLVANDVTKAFLWSPHTQLFNILVPVLAVAATRRVIADRRLERSFALATGAVVGLGMLAYPAFAVIPVCLLPPAAVGMLRRPLAAARRRDLASLGLLGLLSAAPSALWYAYLHVAAAQVFYAELDLREVVWMKDALAQGLGTFLAQWFGYFGRFLAFAAPQALALAALIGWLALTLAVATRRHPIALAPLAAAWPMVAIGLYVSCAMLGFYTCVGYIVPRLAYPAIPPLIVAAGAAAMAIAQRLPARPRAVLAAGCAAIAVAQVIFEVVKPGPWS